MVVKLILSLLIKRFLRIIENVRRFPDLLPMRHYPSDANTHWLFHQLYEIIVRVLRRAAPLISLRFDDFRKHIDLFLERGSLEERRLRSLVEPLQRRDANEVELVLEGARYVLCHVFIEEDVARR